MAGSSIVLAEDIEDQEPAASMHIHTHKRPIVYMRGVICNGCVCVCVDEHRLITYIVGSGLSMTFVAKVNWAAREFVYANYLCVCVIFSFLLFFVVGWSLRSFEYSSFVVTPNRRKGIESL